MAISLDVDRMRSAIRASRLDWQRHVLERAMERGIRRTDAFDVLLSGQLIEDYPDDQPFPSALLLEWIQTRPIHAVAAFDAANERAFVITV